MSISTHKIIYTDMGYASRRDYLKSLAEEHDVPLDIVTSLATVLGPDEDFDALVTEVESLADNW